MHESSEINPHNIMIWYAFIDMWNEQMHAKSAPNNVQVPYTWNANKNWAILLLYLFIIYRFSIAYNEY